MWRWVVSVLLVTVLQAVASGDEARPVTEDPALEARVMRVAEELRCLVCQNQTIADSHAGLAIDLRNRIREQLRQGASEDQVRSYMVQRYGDFVLYRPPVKATTWLLWFGPLMLLAAGALAFGMVLVRRQRVGSGGGLTPDEARRAAALLAGRDAP
jgi:cytochrome c-type biogenesis protein CcmH